MSKENKAAQQERAAERRTDIDLLRLAASKGYNIQHYLEAMESCHSSAEWNRIKDNAFCKVLSEINPSDT